MKILHTADWHIGKALHKHSLEEEMLLFFMWLIALIKKEEVDVLLVSGDIFDLANPGAKDREIYYKLLSQLIPLNIQIVITGGNHDGIGVINAPKELLTSLNISVIGGAKDNLEEELIEIRNDNGDIVLVIAAVPFLRDRDLRSLQKDKQYDSRAEAIKEGIASHYGQLALICSEKYKGIPSIAMGHLFAKGVSSSDSEREIHIGNAAAVESTIFPSEFDYIALGHIHRPQIISKNEFIRYSGSPISLSFSEKEDKKGVLLLKLENGKFVSPKFIDVPKQRELKKFTGDHHQVKEKLTAYKHDYRLPSLVEIEFIEKEYSSVRLSENATLVSEFQDSTDIIILKSRTNFSTGTQDTSDLFTSGENIEDLSPTDVFIKRMNLEEIDELKQKELKETFLELLEIVSAEEV